jgi:nucleoside-diphosphate-sugar epimerase
MAEVLVTGGTGYIGSWCVLALLEAGHSVRTTVRDLRREPALRSCLHAAAPFADDRLTVVRADLEDAGGWEEAVAGCAYVLHVASPTLRHAPADDDAMVVPAREGVLRVLRASRDAGVRRVVATSAFGAIRIGHPPRQTPFTEED